MRKEGCFEILSFFVLDESPLEELKTTTTTFPIVPAVFSSLARRRRLWFETPAVVVVVVVVIWQTRKEEGEKTKPAAKKANAHVPSRTTRGTIPNKRRFFDTFCCHIFNHEKREKERYKTYLKPHFL